MSLSLMRVKGLNRTEAMFLTLNRGAGLSSKTFPFIFVS